MKLTEMAVGYDEAKDRVDRRIQQLRQQINENPELEQELRGRIRALAEAQMELRTVAKICRHYYDRSFHADERFTVQSSSGRRSWRAAKVDSRERRGQRRNAGAAQTAPPGGDPGGADAQAADLLAGVLLRPEKHAGDRRRTRGKRIDGIQNRRKGGKQTVPGAPVLPVTDYMTKGASHET